MAERVHAGQGAGGTGHLAPGGIFVFRLNSTAPVHQQDDITLLVQDVAIGGSVVNHGVGRTVVIMDEGNDVLHCLGFCLGFTPQRPSRQNGEIQEK